MEGSYHQHSQDGNGAAPGMYGNGYAEGMYDQDPYGDEIEGGEEDRNDGLNALNLQYVIGFNKDIDQGVHNLTTPQRHEIFFSSAHTGVIYDYSTKTQRLLQGHCNRITATACSDDKRWIVTADGGDDSMLVVWDSMSGTPIRTYLNPHPNGVKTIDISADNNYLATLGNDEPQTISLWDWTNEKEEGPIVSLQFKYTEEFQNQHWVKFNPSNPQEIASNGKERVLFLSWEPGVPTFQYYSPRIEKKDFSGKDKSEAHFTKTVFIPNKEMAVTGTWAGDLLVWDRSLIIEGIGEQNEKRLIKIVPLNPNYSPINMLMTVHDQYLVCGNSDGTIRFYDFHFKVVAWFEELNLSTVKSISFSKTEPKAAANQDYQQSAEDEVVDKSSAFACSDFLVTDDSALVCMLQSSIFEEIEPAKKKGYTIFHGLKSAVKAIAVHPKRPILAIAGLERFVLFWDYLKKGDPILHNYDLFRKGEDSSKDKEGGGKGAQQFSTMVFTPEGDELLIGQSNGIIQVMDANTGMYKKYSQPLKISENSNPQILSLIVANDGVGGKYFATMDSNQCVCLFKKDYLQGDSTKPIEWQFHGKKRTHEIEISSIAFGESLDENEQTKLRLFSIGRDRRVFEYDIYASSMQKGLEVLTMFKIEKEAHPTACIWYPKVDTKEDLLLTANDDYKMKIWNVSTKNSRRTCLGPTYGGEITKLKRLDIENNSDKFLIYSTKKKVIGLIKMPLDGNPNKTMGLIAHPAEVEDICATSDGRYMFTCGGEDLAVNMWSIDVTPIDQAIALGGEGIEPFINLIEGGRDGQTYQDMKDFFYYSMIRSKDENTTKARRLNGTVPLDELPNLMRAMGYYPTQQEVDNMRDEVKFSNFAETGQHVNAVDLDTFIRLFVNHRPVYGIGKNNIQEAFAAIMNTENSSRGCLQRDDLIRLLREEGECLGQQELEECLNLLVGDANFKTSLPQEIAADDFAENILGFEEVEEVDSGDENGNGEAAGGAMMMGSYGGMGVIPEEGGM